MACFHIKGVTCDECKHLHPDVSDVTAWTVTDATDTIQIDIDPRIPEVVSIPTIFEDTTNAGFIIFHLPKTGEEVLRLTGDGDIYVHGKLVENDIEVVQAMREFLGLGKK